MRLFSFGNRCAFSKIVLTGFLFLFSFTVNAQLIPEQIPRATNPALDVSPARVGSSAWFSPAAFELDKSLNTAIDILPGEVRSSARQPDGKILVGGYFKTLNGARHKGLVRFNADNSLDEGFSAEVNGSVFAIAVQSDGKIVIGGAFTIVNGADRHRVARLHADGSLDASFNMGSSTIDNLVYDLAVQPDGKIVIGGSFTEIGGTVSPNVARLNANGTLDASFTSPIQPPTGITPPPSIVYGLALQPDGKIVLGGFIVTSPGFPSTTTPVARLNPNGTFDASFNPGTINSNALDVAVQPNGKILFAGFFNQINGTPRTGIARLNADGSPDAAFNQGAGANLPVYSIYVRPDGSILIAGIFSSVNGQPRGNVALLKADGTVDPAFAPASGTLGFVFTAIAAANGKVLVGGSFRALAGAERDTVGVLNPDGAPDLSFAQNSTALGTVRTLAVQPDGKIIIGGVFSRVNGISKTRLARLFPDGSLDESFNQSTFTVSAGQITTLLVQPDGKILVGGSSISFGTGNSRSIVRLNADGAPDTGFNQGDISGAGTIQAIAVQPADGKILISYVPDSLRNFGFLGGISRLNPDGSVDATFSAPQLPFETIALLPDGKILAGGKTGIGYVNSGNNQSDQFYGILRLDADGTHDRTFRAQFEASFAQLPNVKKLVPQPDGKILVGGNFALPNTGSAIGLARLNSNGTVDGTFTSNPISSSNDLARIEEIEPLPNGELLVVGRFNGLGAALGYDNIAVLKADGSLGTFYPTNADNTVYDAEIQTDGKILIGGDFETVDGAPRTALARFEALSPRRAPFDFDGDGRADISVFRPGDGSWYLQRSTDGFAAVQFGAANDQIAPADFDGDGKTDFAVFRDNAWYLQRSTAGFAAVQYGQPGDIPQPADFDGDGRAELAVFRPSNGTWYWLNLTNEQFGAVQFGTNGDKPAAADFDGDGKTDFAVFRPASGTWYLLRSQAGFTAVQFGADGDKTVAADFDGDGKADPAVFRPANGTWYLLQSTGGFSAVQFGAPGDLPAAADYDGDGRADPAVFRPADGAWYLNRSTAGFAAAQFGASGDLPAAAAFIR